MGGFDIFLERSAKSLRCYERMFQLPVAQNSPVGSANKCCLLLSFQAEIKEYHKDGHSQYCWNNILLILYRFLEWRFYSVQEAEPNRVVGL